MSSWILRWKTSGAEQIPKGLHFQQYLPKGMLKVVRNDNSSSSSTCQNPFLASNTAKTLAPCKCDNVIVAVLMTHSVWKNGK